MTLAPTASTRAAGLALALASSACAETFTPASVVEDHRVLALRADPPELDGRDPLASATVAATVAAPPGQVLPAGHVAVGRWSFCPFSLGASTAYACAVPRCETPLAAGPDGSVTLRPVQLALACLAALGPAAPPELSGGRLPDRVEVLVRYRLEEVADPAADPPVPGPVLREAVLRLPVWTAAPTAPLNQNPAFASVPVTVGGLPALPCDPAALAGCTPAGTLSPGAPLALEAAVDPATIEDYATGERTAAEPFTLGFFTTAGRLQHDGGTATRQAPLVRTELRWEALPTPAPAQALLWVVLRDLRGGQAVAGPYLVRLQP